MTTDGSKVALVTGAARGIGLATAKRFLAEDWRVAALDIDGDILWPAVQALNKPGDVIGLHCDVSEASAVKSAIAEIERKFGRLDALVNNAGIATFAPVMETSDAEWSRIMAVNLTGPFLCTKAAVPLMREHGGGAIVNITSISAVRASTLRAAYGTSKAGLAHLTKQLAVELASSASASTPSRLARSKPRWRKRYIPRKSALTTMMRFRSTVTGWKRNWRRRSSSCAATARATSRDKCSPWMEASTRPASACRRCAANGGTANIVPIKRRLVTVRELCSVPCDRMIGMFRLAGTSPIVTN